MFNLPDVDGLDQHLQTSHRDARVAAETAQLFANQQRQLTEQTWEIIKLEIFQLKNSSFKNNHLQTISFSLAVAAPEPVLVFNMK